MAQQFLTKKGYQKLLDELNILKSEKLPTVLQRLKEAIGQGDISENSDYDAAMSEKDLLEVRISEIESMIQDVEIIEEGHQGGEIKYNSRVVLEDEKGKKYEYTIVGGGEVDVLEGTMSFDSPLGVAIKGKKVGETVQVRAPRGRYKMKILEVK